MREPPRHSADVHHVGASVLDEATVVRDLSGSKVWTRCKQVGKVGAGEWVRKGRVRRDRQRCGGRSVMQDEAETERSQTILKA